MKTILKTLILASLVLASSAHSREDDAAKLIYKNSEAGFAGESMEHSLMQFALTHHTDLKDLVTGATVTILDAQNSEVMIETNNASFAYQCRRFTTLSRGGTVVKKEVVCQK